MPSESDYRFVTLDWKGRTVRMTSNNFERHCKYRPMMADYVQEAQVAIGDPDHVQQAHGALRLCRLGLGRGEFTNMWMWVVVYYNTNPAGVATYLLTSKLPDEPIIEQRALYFNGKRHLLGRGLP